VTAPYTQSCHRVEADRLEQLEGQQKRIDTSRKRHKKPGFIQHIKQAFIEAKEVMDSGENEDNFADQNAQQSAQISMYWCGTKTRSR